MSKRTHTIIGRGAVSNPQGRFEHTKSERVDDGYQDVLRQVAGDLCLVRVHTYEARDFFLEQPDELLLRGSLAVADAFSQRELLRRAELGAGRACDETAEVHGHHGLAWGSGGIVHPKVSPAQAGTGLPALPQAMGT